MRFVSIYKLLKDLFNINLQHTISLCLDSSTRT